MGIGRTAAVAGMVGLVAAGAAFTAGASWRDAEPPPVSVSTVAGASAADRTAPASPAGPTPTSVGPDAGIARVVDGDTFELTDGQRVRVLGIDSCEMSTPGGALAMRHAEILLSAGSVTITSQPGVDRDRYGRLLRYVSVADGADFGEVMASLPHTGVYEGTNDASPTHLARLHSVDADGRDCRQGLPTVHVPDIEWPDLPRYEWPQMPRYERPDMPRYEMPRYEVPDLELTDPTGPPRLEPAPPPELPEPQPIEPQPIEGPDGGGEG